MEPEPGAIATDAFNTPWDFPLSYLFPPFGLIRLCLKKVMQKQVDCFAMAPVGRSWPWYPALLSMLIERPLLLFQGQRILKRPGIGKVHPLCCQEKFQLAAWKQHKPSNMVVLGKAGVARVVEKRLSLFLQLYNIF